MNPMRYELTGRSDADQVLRYGRDQLNYLLNDYRSTKWGPIEKVYNSARATIDKELTEATAHQSVLTEEEAKLSSVRLTEEVDMRRQMNSANMQQIQEVIKGIKATRKNLLDEIDKFKEVRDRAWTSIDKEWTQTAGLRIRQAVLQGVTKTTTGGSQ